MRTRFGEYPLKTGPTEGKPTVLLIGLDRYVLRACQRNDIDTVVLCPPNARDDGLISIPSGMTSVAIDDHRSVEAILSALNRAGLDGRRFSAVQTTEERAVVAASVVADLLACPAIDPWGAVRFRDKASQKDRIRSAGIATARTTVIDDIYRVNDVPFEFDKAVLKPITGAGTKLTTLLRSMEELISTSIRYREQGVASRTFLLEEFVEGDEWAVDGVVWGGEVLFFALASYAKPCLSAVHAQDPVVMRRLDPMDQEREYALAEPLIQRAVRALGLSNGVFHMELFHDLERDRLIFGECAARRGGGLVQEEVLAKFNVDLGESALMCALDRRPDLNVKVRPGVIGSAYLSGRPGTLFRCPSAAELLARPGVEFARIELPFGTTLSRGFADTMHRLGLVMLAAGRVDEFSTRVRETREWFGSRLVVAPPDATSGGLGAWQRENWPETDFRDLLYEQR